MMLFCEENIFLPHPNINNLFFSRYPLKKFHSDKRAPRNTTPSNNTFLICWVTLNNHYLINKTWWFTTCLVHAPFSLTRNTTRVIISKSYYQKLLITISCQFSIFVICSKANVFGCNRKSILESFHQTLSFIILHYNFKFISCHATLRLITYGC